LTPPFKSDVASHDVSIVGVRERLDIEDQVLAREGGEKTVLFCVLDDEGWGSRDERRRSRVRSSEGIVAVLS